MRSARKVIVGLIFGAVVLVPAGIAAAATNPSGTGRPGQSCQDIVAANGTEPGHASSSPGSPFNEPGPNNPGGTGGLHYSATSQYDVACFQVSSR
jgi:hypothetical protein